MRIVAVEPVCVNVSPKTNWFFIEIATDAGLTGVGEASLNGYEPLLEAETQRLAGALAGMSADEAVRITRFQPGEAAGRVGCAVKSALEQALTDLRAQARGVPVHTMLGGKRRTEARVYANINRRTEDRSPAGCAASAREAEAQGYHALKIAPFDGVFPDELGTTESNRRLAAGLARVQAMRDAVDPRTELMVDCHWRFDEPTAAAMIRALEPMDLIWVECPISEQPECWEANARLHELCNAGAMWMAGGEHALGLIGFEPIIARRLFDIVMPDVKYAGGFHEVLRIASRALDADLAFSPHNPTGPICAVASLHLAACAENFMTLEHQLGESELFFDLVGGWRPQLRAGTFVVPDAPGLGVKLDREVARAHPYKPVPPGPDPRLG